MTRKMTVGINYRAALAWFGWIALLVVASVLAAYGIALIRVVLLQFGWLSQVNGNVVNLVSQSAIYVVAATLVFVLAKAVRRDITACQAGVNRLMNWRDIGLTLLGAVAYVALTVLLAWVAQEIVPWYDTQQTQNVGISGRLFSYDLLVGFVTLVLIAPFFEELVFRGVLYGKLRAAKLAAVPAALVVSMLFALAHGQWNVGVDAFALSLVACFLREKTEAIWAGFLLHMIKNAVAFYSVYVMGGF